MGETLSMEGVRMQLWLSECTVIWTSDKIENVETQTAIIMCINI